MNFKIHHSTIKFQVWNFKNSLTCFKIRQKPIELRWQNDFIFQIDVQCLLKKMGLNQNHILFNIIIKFLQQKTMNPNFNYYLWAQSNLFTQNLSPEWLQYSYFYLNQQYNFIEQNSSIELHRYQNYQNDAKIEYQEQKIKSEPTRQEENEENEENQENINIQTENKLNDSNIHRGKPQKEDRNLSSIVIRNFTNFINRHPHLQKIVSQIISKKRLSITDDEFRSLFLKVFPLGQSYVGIGKLKSFLRKKGDASVITLILMRKFISTDYFTVMIHSKKVVKSAKLKELIHGKKLWMMLLNKIK